jgi:hypothetical protein
MKKLRGGFTNYKVNWDVVTIVLVVILIIVFIWKRYWKGDVHRGPPNAEELGRSTWTLLHTIATRLPEEPSDREKIDIKTFIHLFARYYPCVKCGYHMQQYLEGNPIRTETKSDLEHWFCQFHNAVNKRLGKPIFDCRMLSTRWHYDHGCGVSKCPA